MPATRSARNRPATAGATRACPSIMPLPPISSVDHHVALHARYFLVVHVLADLAPELLHRLVRAILLELPQHSSADAGNRLNVLVARGVQIDRHEDVLLEARELGGVDVLPDL